MIKKIKKGNEKKREKRIRVKKIFR